ncbi:formate dehydrogenase accessory protein FdhE [Hyphomicrobium sp.]|jgi:FdhE protein|uniref:formate dehydrogenase accessory protein FdhE n=1 Tax=Hyphomicrobium sp. TaxID=82 RepID=UPI002BFDB48B|nr:formate dehydrogenase accessory protein FdhE [Hyphomicrobium sp.]HVZ05691.1 formate dehydrogenase accessory protein FdhE [Hyphomicrobium sp.]
MKQGGSPPTGKWAGSPLGGVEAPDPIYLPDPTLRFLATASRFESLAKGHPMAEWLRFIAAVSRAQHAAATSLTLAVPLAQTDLEQAVENRKPPLAPTEQLDPAWRDGLAIMLDSLDHNVTPDGSARAIDELRRNDASAIEAIAHDFLCETIDSREAVAAFYVAAALQVYFTLMAGSLRAKVLRLLPERGLCPCCGSTPVSGIITASGKTPGTRYLYCSLCSTAWNHVRAVCITCASTGALSLRGIEGDSGAVKAEVCDDCHTYAKMLYQSKDLKVDPFADDLASLGLDMMVSDAGWARHAPNPLLLAR